MLLVDSDIIIDSARGDAQAKDFLRNSAASREIGSAICRANWSLNADKCLRTSFGRLRLFLLNHSEQRFAPWAIVTH
jgi:hypothetical protein